MLPPEADPAGNPLPRMNQPPYKVLILCTGNSARSILAEYLLRVRVAGRFETHSAGAIPTGRVNPLALWVLREDYGIDASGARSKSWDEFRAVAFDFVITVCDHAKESCPLFPGRAITAHFSSPDPAAAHGSEEARKKLFREVAGQIARRVDALCALPDGQLDAEHVRAIGEQFKLDGESRLAR